MPLLKDARGPEGLRLYAIGDVHGRLDLLRARHAAIATDLVRRPVRAFRVIHLGDYVDRGPDSAGVIAALIEFCRDGDGVCLAGNHDVWMLRFLAKPTAANSAWTDFGGVETLISYGVSPYARGMGLRPLKALGKDLRAALPPEHEAFLRGLRACERHGDYFFAHAGVRPGRALERQSLSDLTEIREPFLSEQGDFGAVVVHGHTVTPEPCVKPNRIGIDTKAYASGVLTCLVLEGAEKGWLTPEGYAPLMCEA
ncbi:metallophosphoesterase [Rubrimonas cliftonensis]|uniref:Serine/threonine protein phosphatase 1 n=1 Tax=Rubrimonas cliftonensis TaxID=89524 RepID=A0A1H4A1N2_9RHOB|nr:metallophosphoesterase [Rubrimonas cliftonensis]SEA30073.1 serine/threonine protein phosphatase 1 [Rubrimonas cliftonensis]